VITTPFIQPNQKWRDEFAGLPVNAFAFPDRLNGLAVLDYFNCQKVIGVNL
jgi:hypothetical protein